MVGHRDLKRLVIVGRNSESSASCLCASQYEAGLDWLISVCLLEQAELDSGPATAATGRTSVTCSPRLQTRCSTNAMTGVSRPPGAAGR